MDTCWVPRPLPARVPAMTLRPDPCGEEPAASTGAMAGPEAGPGRRGSRDLGRGRSGGDRWRRPPPRPELDLFASALSAGPSHPIGQRPGLRLKPLCPPPRPHFRSPLGAGASSLGGAGAAGTVSRTGRRGLEVTRDGALWFRAPRCSLDGGAGRQRPVWTAQGAEEDPGSC